METLHVADSLHGTRLQDFLARVWPDVDQRYLRQLIESEAVLVNGQCADGRRRLHGGDLVMVDVGESVRALPMHKGRGGQGGGQDIAILAEFEKLMVVDKPAGMATLDDRAGKFLGVCGHLERRGPLRDLRAVHRLEPETSGCLLLSRGVEASRFLHESFEAGQIREQYLALVEGRVRQSGLEIDSSLGPDPSRPGRVAVVAKGSKKSRPARTRVDVEECFNGYSLLRLRPWVARSHQLRVHLRSIGHPIVGDREYGGRSPLLLSDFKHGYKIRKGVKEAPLLSRMFLHAAEIEFDDPGGEGCQRVRANLSEDLELVLKKLRHFAALPVGRGRNTERT